MTPSPVARFAKSALVLTLSLSLSGVLPVIGNVREARADHLNLQEITQQGQDLDENLKVQVRRARHPGTPGTPPGIPNAADMTAVETEVAAWKGKIEQVLALPNEPAHPGDDYVPTEVKLRAINTYLNELTLLATLRIALNYPHGPTWSDAFALLVPRAVVSEIPGLGTLASNRMGDRFMPMIVDRGPNNQADPARLKLSASLVQGLELGRLADVQNDDTNLTMLKYLATRQLLANLTDLRYLKQDHNVEVPEIPAPLRAKLESMGLAKVIADEQHRAVAEPGARASLIKTFAGVASQFPAFATDALITGIANAVGKTADERAAAKAPLQESLTAAERDNMNASLEQEIASSSTPFSVQSAQELDESLRVAAANAKANTQLQKIMEMLANQTLGDLSVEQRRQVMNLLDARKAAYQTLLDSGAVHSWQSAAKRATDQLLYEDQRSHFIENLTYHAAEAVHDIQRTYSGDIVDPEILSQVFAKELIKLGPSDNANDWFYQIHSAGSYIAARSKYNDLLVKQTQADVVVNGIVDPAKAKDFIDHHDFTPEIPFTANTEPALARRIRDRIAASRRGDLRALVEYGTWMGFHRVYAGGDPSVHEVLTDNSKADDYFRRLDESVTTRYPILGVEISLTAPDGSENSSRLADALAAINPNHVSRPDIEEKAALLVDQALIQIEAKIRQDIETIGNAKSAADIEKVVTSSMMLALVMHGFPEFRVYEEQFIETLLSPSLTDQLMRRYAGPAMMYGFGAIMITKGINWLAKRFVKRAFPVTNILSLGFDSMMAGYMRAAMVLILADTAYQVSEVLHERSQRQQQEDFFFCSVEGSCFTDAATLNASNSAYEWAKWSLVGRLAMDAVMFYFPMAKGLINRMGDKVIMAELVADSEAFRTMKLKPGEFGRVERAMRIARALREGKPVGPEVIEANPDNGAYLQVKNGRIKLPGVFDIDIGGGSGWIRAGDVLLLADLEKAVSAMSAEEWAQLEQGYNRLSAQIRAGKTYRLPTVIDRMAIEDAFKELDLSAKKPESWEKIEKQRALHEKAAPTPAAKAKVNRAAKFLETYLAESPSVKTTEFVPTTSTERRLLAALKRSPVLEQFWANFAAQETEALHLNPAPQGAAPQGAPQ